MECKANLVGVSNDILTGKVNITFSTIDKHILNIINEIQNIDLRLNAKKWAEKRSLDSNAYLWVLCTKIAEKLNTSKEEVYENLLQRYGFCYEDDNGYVVISVKSCVDMSKVQGHWKYYKDSSDGKFKSYIMLKGSSEYDTLEMSNFLKMVVEDAKELGIETMTDEEIRRMNEQWHVNLS